MVLTAQPCFMTPGKSPFNLIKKCYLYGSETDCTEIFKPVITDNGICCAANAR